MFEVYCCDCETDGLDPVQNSPIEICFYRLATDETKTWCMKPVNTANIQTGALRVNGHKLADLLHQTPEGRARYKAAETVLPEIESWLMADGVSAEQRILLGHNVGFDIDMLTHLWKKCGSEATFPCNSKYRIDTMQMEFSMDYANNTFGEGYSLRNLAKKHGVKNDKAHTAEADVKTTVAIYRKQLAILKLKSVECE
jgi:DNA polymerase III epsilon subunit-like protein